VNREKVMSDVPMAIDDISQLGPVEIGPAPRSKLGRYTREIEFVASLPMTTTGKVMRRELRRGVVTPDA
jgi:acyl-CoA synthetase (AMP-forming)/AMP-acid ligase II